MAYCHPSNSEVAIAGRGYGCGSSGLSKVGDGHVEGLAQTIREIAT